MDELHPAPLRLERQPAGGWGQGHARDERHLEHLEQRPRVPDPAGRPDPLRRLTGSWAALFVSCGFVNWLMCLLFARYCSLVPARVQLAARDARAKGRA